MASLAADPDLSSQLEIALTRQSQQAIKLDSPQELLHEALKNLVAQGYDIISPTHVTLEIRKLISQGNSSFTDDVPEWVKPGWVGRLLRSLDVVEGDPEGGRRMRVHGKNLRFYAIPAAYLDEVKEWFGRRKTEISVGARQPTDFCKECESCPYNALNCEIMLKR